MIPDLFENLQRIPKEDSDSAEMRAEPLGPLNPTARRGFWPSNTTQSFNVQTSAPTASHSGASPHQG
jgi:hypothetical protein